MRTVTDILFTNRLRFLLFFASMYIEIFIQTNGKTSGKQLHNFKVLGWRVTFSIFWLLTNISPLDEKRNSWPINTWWVSFILKKKKKKNLSQRGKISLWHKKTRSNNHYFSIAYIMCLELHLLFNTHTTLWHCSSLCYPCSSNEYIQSLRSHNP